MRTGRRGREREIKEMGVESGERRRVLGLLITSAPMGRKMNLEQNEEKGEGGGVEEKKNKNIFITLIMKTLHILVANLTLSLMYVYLYVCDFIKILTTATLPSGKFRYRLFLDKDTSLLRCLK